MYCSIMEIIYKREYFLSKKKQTFSTKGGIIRTMQGLGR